MSLVVSNCFQIANSPLNHSTAKSLYSIPKASRFNEKYKSYCNQAFYDLPSQKDKRKAAIGYGYKYDFTKGQQQTPAASHYQIKSTFQEQREKNKGKSVGVSRENMESGGILGSIKQINSPGPGRYDLQNTKSNIKYSFRVKILYGDPFDDKNKKNPGPGTYKQPTTLNSTGKYFNSKYKSSGAGLINPSRSVRFEKGNKSQMLVPGPGQYQPQSLPKDGKYLLSKSHSNSVRSFSLSQRNTFGNGVSTPGPGSYRLPSEFGYYESKSKSGQSRPGTTSNRTRLLSNNASFVNRPGTTQTENKDNRGNNQNQNKDIQNTNLQSYDIQIDNKNNKQNNNNTAGQRPSTQGGSTKNGRRIVIGAQNNNNKDDNQKQESNNQGEKKTEQ